MTNHVHLLATPNDVASLPKTPQSAGRRYVQYFNVTYRRSGTLWEGRYRATVIDSEPYLLTCMRYVEENPVRAGMVVNPAATAGQATPPTPWEARFRLRLAATAPAL